MRKIKTIGSIDYDITDKFYSGYLAGYSRTLLACKQIGVLELCYLDKDEEVNMDNKNFFNGSVIVNEDGEKVMYRIRMLTPSECFKLMGMHDEDVQKARNLGLSDTALYQEAGNGIVTDCVKLLAEHLYKAQYDPSYECTDEVFLKSKERQMTIFDFMGENNE